MLARQAVFELGGEWRTLRRACAGVARAEAADADAGLNGLLLGL
jgi:hypothetical protein